ncbi:hypothetical protein [Streptococcus halichoeri]|uniref:hypothetical protein n=1 Tax=Streptococcus halichoeri TaxID=254785 RepID=UPI001359B695|nr:hypothetical protein [Streptococcus halichoeri]
MTTFCKKLAIAAMTSLALAGACLTAAHTSKADDLFDFSDFDEFLLAPKKDGYKDILDFLTKQGVEDFYAETYLENHANEDFKELLVKFKTKPQEVKTEVTTEMSKTFQEAAPVPVYNK